MYKICSKCGASKSIKGFAKDKQKRDGLRSSCKACAHEKYVQNATRHKAKTLEYYYKHRDQIRKRQNSKNHYYNHTPQAREGRKKYKQNNPQKARAYIARRRAQKLRATPSWADLKKIEHVYWVANFLSELTGIPHEVDHIHPLLSDKICGLHTHTNLQILTATENRQKSNKFEV